MNNWTKYAGGGAIVTVGILFVGRTWIMSCLGYGGISIIRQVLQDKKVHETAKDTVLSLTNELLDDPQLKAHTNKLIEQVTGDASVKSNMKNCVKDIAEDEETSQFTTRFIVGIFSKQETKDAFSRFAVDVLRDPETKQAVSGFLVDIISQPEILVLLKQKLVDLIKMIANDNDLTIEIRQYLIKMFDDDTIRDLITRTGTVVLTTQELETAGIDYLVKVAGEEVVKKQISDLLSGTVVDSVNNQKVQDELQGMVMRSLQSEDLRKSTASALSSVVKQSLTPSWWAGNSNHNHNNGNEDESDDTTDE